jgi:hypothetical protein
LERYFDQVPICGCPGFLILGVKGVHQPVLGSTVVVLVEDAVPLSAAMLKQACQHSHTVTQQTRIAWLMNIGFDDSAIDPHLAALIDLFAFGPIKKYPVNSFPGRGTDLGYVIPKSRTFESPATESDPHKAAHRCGILEMKSQIPIRVSMHLLEQSGSKNLFGCHSIGPSRLTLAASREVLVNQINYGIVLIKYVTDGLQLDGLGMIDCRGCQRHLFFSCFAHFVLGSFFLLVVFLRPYNLFYTIRRTNGQHKMRFFCI